MKKSILLFAATLFAAATFAQTPTVSASSVTFKYCESTSSAISITIPASQLPYLWNDEYIEEFGTSVHTLVNARGCDSIVAVTLNDAKGAIPFAFSISEDKQVYFSQGNLQYCAAPTSGEITHKVAYPENDTQKGIFRFAEHQYDFVGDETKGNVYKDGKKSNNKKFAEDYDGWIDIFCWGATGYDGYTPYGLSYRQFNYNNSDIDYSSTQKYWDFGMYNAISNGGNTPEKWFMLTYSQWDYLLNTRTDAHKKIAYATVNNIVGTILLPDEWTLPSGLSFDPTEGQNVNKYTAEEWERMEVNGAVFLANGVCHYFDMWGAPSNYGSEGYYWTSSCRNGAQSYEINALSYLIYEYNNKYGPSTNLRGGRCSVRLVRYTTTTF